MLRSPNPETSAELAFESHSKVKNTNPSNSSAFAIPVWKLLISQGIKFYGSTKLSIVFTLQRQASRRKICNYR